MNGKWIWLDKNKYPDRQISKPMRDGDIEDEFSAVEFQRNYKFDKKIIRATVNASASMKYQLWINKNYIGRGPIDDGGDIDLHESMLTHYFNTYEVDVNNNEISFFSRVYSRPTAYSDYGLGHGGFFVDAVLHFEDGSEKNIFTDETWNARLNSMFIDANNLDTQRSIGEYENTSVFDFPLQNFKKSPIPNLADEYIECKAEKIEENKYVITFDKIICGFLFFDLHTKGKITLTADYVEIKRHNSEQEIVADRDLKYQSLVMKSCERIIITVSGDTKDYSIENIGFIFTHYPCDDSNSFFNCSDEGLNKVYDVCKYTLKLCRQTMHLDSPMHQEPLGCTGDYYIESLMNYYSYGDSRLTRLDLVRTAERLKIGNGYMFHTTHVMDSDAF